MTGAVVAALWIKVRAAPHARAGFRARAGYVLFYPPGSGPAGVPEAAGGMGEARRGPGGPTAPLVAARGGRGVPLERAGGLPLRTLSVAVRELAHPVSALKGPGPSPSTYRYSSESRAQTAAAILTPADGTPRRRRRRQDLFGLSGADLPLDVDAARGSEVPRPRPGVRCVSNAPPQLCRHTGPAPPPRRAPPAPAAGAAEIGCVHVRGSR